ncbi:TPA: glycosyltransferase [Streptococcus suis]|uniref:glycosyltransferase family 8 protein n=1 Tax=Streptococcus suis TaxID=1307 RepID=UPI00041DC800|nr:glycosyltransferase [Streptococcus suis]NQM00239.1 glycosyltransferase [Streptococcus suis]QZT28593.1 glycosyltransferase [Streptococcus suis]HEM3198616.1 glycosyltransferase [Streptococcus suis 14A]HEM4282600.1 glycosyltransferase [Streptococcus suis]HEM4284541.1 glycosyltransferase [Streptococcus suis]
MNLAFTVSDSYMDYMGTTLYSIMVHTRKSPVSVYVLTSDISDYSRFKLQKLEDRFHNLNIHILVVDAKQFEDLPLNRSHITRPEVYFRMAFASLLPDLDRILYLDSDILAQKDLQPLWETPLDGAYMAAVSEPPSEGGFDYRRSIGMTDPTYYFNSGVLLMDLKKIREDKIESLLFECGHAIKDKIRLQDQDIINVALEGKIKALDPIYNYGYMERQANLRKEADIVLNHFSLEKPWNRQLDVPEYNRLAVNRYLECHQAYLQFIEPKISLVLPIFEAANSLDKTLESIHQQVYRNIDCIILDYSADRKTKEICLVAISSSSHFRYYSFSPNNKDTFLQAGLEKMAGNYLSLIYANDWVDSFYLANLFLALEENQADISKVSCSQFEQTTSNFYFFNPLWQEKQVLDGKSYLQQTQLAPSQQVSYYQSLSGMLLAPKVVTSAWQRRTDLPGQLLTRFLIDSQASLVYLPEVAYISSNSQPVQTLISNSQKASDYFTALMAYHVLTKGADKDFYRHELLSLSNNTATLTPNLAEEIDIQLELLR